MNVEAEGDGELASLSSGQRTSSVGDVSSRKVCERGYEVVQFAATFFSAQFYSACGSYIQIADQSCGLCQAAERGSEVFGLRVCGNVKRARLQSARAGWSTSWTFGTCTNKWWS